MSNDRRYTYDPCACGDGFCAGCAENDADAKETAMKTTTPKIDKLARALGRRYIGVTVERNVATVTVRANADADDCIEEAREAVAAVLPQTLSAAWADETREAVVVEAWL